MRDMRRVTKAVTAPRAGRQGAPVKTGGAVLSLSAFFAAFVLSGAPAWAATSTGVTGYAENVGDNTSVIIDIFAYVAFVIGVALSALGVLDLKKHVENPQTPLKNGLSKLGFGGMLLSLPFIVAVVAETMDDGNWFGNSLLKSFTFGGSGAGNGLGSLIKNGINQGAVLINVAAFAAYTIGVFFILRGLQMMRAHIENPSSAPLPDSLKRLGVGGVMVSLPMVVGVIYDTFAATSGGITNSGYTTSGASGGGLDSMFLNLMQDIADPMYGAIELFAYIAGILLILFALQRMVKTAQDGPRGPLGFGTITTFIVAALLLSLPEFIATINESLFGSTNALSRVTFMSSISSAMDTTQAQNVFSAVLAFMAVIGFLSIVRGLFLLKTFADGGQASMMSVVTHLVAGALAVNLGGLINALQTSLGISSFPVTFS